MVESMDYGPWTMDCGHHSSIRHNRQIYDHGIPAAEANILQLTVGTIISVIS